MTARFDPAQLPESPDLSFEIPLWASGMHRVGGIDEAGRGAWAGPVAAGAVILPPDPQLPQRLAGVRDSKQMTPSQRAFWAEEIRAAALAWGVGFASHEEVDQIGIVGATRLAVSRALSTLPLAPDTLLVDFLALPGVRLPQLALVKGDARSLSIAAASVLAKTARDERMVTLDRDYPGYGFASHKGYGTRCHQEALALLGPSPIHRQSFAPVQACRAGTPQEI